MDFSQDPLCHSGGLEILFGNQSTVSVDVDPRTDQNEVCRTVAINQSAVPPTSQQACTSLQLDIGHLLFWLRDNLLTERPELFLQGNTV